MVRRHASELCVGAIALAIGIWLGLSRGEMLQKALLQDLAPTPQDIEVRYEVELDPPSIRGAHALPDA